MIQAQDVQPLQSEIARCDSAMDGLRCELIKRHDGLHAAEITRDEEGRVDGAVTWKGEALGEHLEDPRDDKPEMDAPNARTSPEGYPLNEDGEFDLTAMAPKQLADFWLFMDAKERAAKEIIGGYKTAARTRIEAVIRERRAANPKAVEIPHAALLIAMKDDWTPYTYDKKPETIEAVKAILPEDDFAKIATWKPEFVPEPVPAHWEIKPTAHATVNAYIEKWDGTPEGDLLKRFMTRTRTGESLRIEWRKPPRKDVSPSGDAS